LADRLPVDLGGVGPQAFEVIERPCVGLEDMQHDIAIVEEHPLGFGYALDSQWIAI